MRRAELAPEHLTGQRDGYGRCGSGDLRRDLHGARQDVGGGHELAHEAGGESLRSREDAAGDRPVHRCGDADDARQEPGGTRFGHDAATGERQTEPGGIGGDADVCREDHRDADPHGRSVDSGNDRLVRGEDAKGELAAHVASPTAERLEPGAVGVVAAGPYRQVGTGREELAGPCDHHGAHAVVAVGECERGEQLVEHRVGDRVAGRGPVDGDHHHAIVSFDAKLVEVVGHGRCSRGRPRTFSPRMLRWTSEVPA